MGTAITGTLSTANTSSTKLTFIPSTGTLNSTVFNSLSDRAAKDNIRNIGYGLTTVLQLQGKKFEMHDTGETSIGFIAQEVEELIPEVVIAFDTDKKGINYSVLVAVLVEAIKELNKRIGDLERR